jgi:hypothetical protein
MARRVFYSFHYIPDNWRASQVRNIGAVEGNKAVSDNAWETITGGGDKAIAKWIAEQMSGRSCVVVLIGAGTAGRKWINHEIVQGWDANKGVLGIHIHNLKNSEGKTSTKGQNPFDLVTHGQTGKKLSSIVKVYDPPGATSVGVYNHIRDNMEAWIEAAIAIRSIN